VSTGRCPSGCGCSHRRADHLRKRQRWRRYNADTDHVAVDLEITPTDNLGLRLAYDNYDTDSSVLIRMPQDFSTEASKHSETGQLLEGAFRWRVAPSTSTSGTPSSRTPARSVST